ncbi:transcriptional regulator, partial [Streptomyces sp. B1866]|nr:transcriptional regulator [Streptomyces sp. B1866]
DPAWLAGRLREESTRLRELAAGEPRLPGALRSAYDEAPDGDRRAFRLLGLAPDGSFGTWVAAAVLGVGAERAQPRLRALVAARLLTERRGRYRLHPLLRLLALERLAQEDAPEAAHAATARMCAAYTQAAEAGREAAARGSVEWFAQERTGLVQAVVRAHGAGLWRETVRLADGMTAALEALRAWDDWDRTHTLALDAARRTGDRPAQARMLRSLGDLAWRRRWLPNAQDLYEQARRAADPAAGRDAPVPLAPLRPGGRRDGRAVANIPPWRSRRTAGRA